MRMEQSMAEKFFTYDKKTILKSLRANLVDHKKDHKEAMKDFWRATIKSAEIKLKQLKKKERESLSVHLSKPEDHSSDYEDFISALEFAQEETIELTIREYKRYVNNSWEWMENYELAKMSYSQILG